MTKSRSDREHGPLDPKQSTFNSDLLKGSADLFGEAAPGDQAKQNTDAHWQVYAMQKWQRELSEAILDANREAARLAVEGKGRSEEAIRVQQQIAELQKNRAELHDRLANELNRLNALEQRNDLKDEPPLKAETNAADREKKLLPIRHANRDFFLADLFEYAMKDDGVSMEAPIFTLAAKTDLSTWNWTSKDGTRSIEVYPSVKGRATQHDKDVLIYVISQMTEGLNRQRADAKNRTVRFRVHDYLVVTNKGTGGRDYKELEKSFERLAGTRIRTDIRTGGDRVREGFGIIDSWAIVEKSNQRMDAVEITLSKWLYNAVQAFEVLTINPNYFRLRKPLERRLYELARKHCGRQASWKISLEVLRDKAGSRSVMKEFRRMVRAIVGDDTLPDYRMSLDETDMVEFTSRGRSDFVAQTDDRKFIPGTGAVS